jgi:hypothetical protein
VYCSFASSGRSRAAVLEFDDEVVQTTQPGAVPRRGAAGRGSRECCAAFLCTGCLQRHSQQETGCADVDSVCRRRCLGGDNLGGCGQQAAECADGADGTGDPGAPLPHRPGRINWSAVPPSLDPAGEGDGGIGQLEEGTYGTTSRGVRKRWQVESVYCALCTLIDAMVPEPEPASTSENDRRLRVVDFGSGSGNASLTVAWLLRKRCSFVLLDMKPVASNLASGRVNQVPGLAASVRCVMGRIEEYAEPFDLGIAVHACGIATDCAQLQCTRRRVP